MGGYMIFQNYVGFCCISELPDHRYMGLFSYTYHIPSADSNIQAWGWILAQFEPGDPFDEIWSPGFHLDLRGPLTPREEPVPDGDWMSNVPADHFLGAPSPNPFNPATTIRFGLKEPAAVHMGVYEVNGRLVRSFHNGDQLPAGRHEFTWDGRNDQGVQISSGIYFLKFRAGDVSETKKLILMR
jgi:hypothetical protein